MIRLTTVVTAALFLVSSIMNFGAKIPLGFTELSFSTPLMSIAEFEVVIGLALLAAAAFSWLYVYAGAYLLALVGIAFGLANPDVQGLARNLHEAMLPFAIGGCVLLALGARSAYNSRANPSAGQIKRELITALQFFVGGLVVIGGAAFARNGTYPLGTVLGLIHLAVGLTGLFAGYAFLRRKVWSRRLLIAINGVIIAYSTFSESLAQVYALLPPGINESLIGTVLAIVVSAAILYLLLSKRAPVKVVTKTWQR
jgi:hypothetical protein